MASAFGSALKEWRGRRRISQLALGLAANVSARHIAFLETGRARPSQAMVMHLGETLDMPRTERNRMLDAAGFRPAFSARPLDSAEMDPVRRAIARVIERHDPYPAFVIDRHWKLVSANRVGASVLSAFGVATGGSMIDILLRTESPEAIIENRQEVILHSIARLRTESTHLGGDPVLDKAASQLSDDPSLTNMVLPANMPPFVPARYRIGGHTYSVFGVIAQFGSAEDIALADLRIELLFPADEATRQAFEALV